VRERFSGSYRGSGRDHAPASGEGVPQYQPGLAHPPGAGDSEGARYRSRTQDEDFISRSSYNTGGYDAVETLHLLDGVIDIYMPDAKYGSNGIAHALSGAADYVDRMKEALSEMHRQVGDIIIRDGIAERGMIIRHLVLPGGLAGTEEVLRFIADELSLSRYVNIMPQYRPAWKVWEIDCVPEALRLRITQEEFDDALATAREYGLNRGFSNR
jgi:putative pyruvate formate lyase activating enzyme